MGHLPLPLPFCPPPRLPCPLPLALQVVDHERSDLQESAMRLVRQLAEYTITLKQLEDNLLARLAASQVWAGSCPPAVCCRASCAVHAVCAACAVDRIAATAAARGQAEAPDCVWC